MCLLIALRPLQVVPFWGAGRRVSVGSAYQLWVQDMTQGPGWIAVALVNFARWRPWGALAGAGRGLNPRLAAQGFALLNILY